MKNFVKHAVSLGGSIKPVVIDSARTQGTGLLNPSVFVDPDTGAIMAVVRHINYTLYHSENKQFRHQYGPLTYVHPEDDVNLRTDNYLCVFDQNLNLVKCHHIDTQHNDLPPKWKFIGVEDARLFKWQGKFYVSGVRRDTEHTGQGRMDLVEISITDDAVTEISRFRIPGPGNNHTYCEKNWMPVLDQPYHYVKWSNPTEVVQVDPDQKTCVTVHVDQTKAVSMPNDLRGSSQVVPWGDYYVAITHEVEFFQSQQGQKDGRYRHRFILWDRTWNLLAESETFDFMTGEIEFACGLALHQGQFIISFGFQDNAAFLLTVPESVVIDMLDLWMFSPTPTTTVSSKISTP